MHGSVLVYWIYNDGLRRAMSWISHGPLACPGSVKYLNEDWTAVSGDELSELSRL